MSFSSLDSLAYNDIFFYLGVEVHTIMSERAADAVFQALFSLTDIRVILRVTAPDHSLDEDQKKKTEKALVSVEKQIAILREELL